MALFAEAGCILRVDVRCEQCRYKILEVLSSITGIYNVDIDGTRGLVKVFGEVDPNVLLRAVASTGRHAEVIRINFKHPSWSHSYHAGPLGYPLDYRHHYPIGGSALACMANDYPFRRTTGHGFGLSHRHAPIGVSFGHGLSHTGAVFGGGHGLSHTGAVFGSHHGFGGNCGCNHF